MAKDAGALQHLLLKQWKSPFSDATVTLKKLHMIVTTQSREIESTHLQQFTANAPANSPHLSIIQAAFTLSTMTVQKDAGASCRFPVLPHINVSSYSQLLAGKMMTTEDRRRSIAVVREETHTQQRRGNISTRKRKCAAEGDGSGGATYKAK